MLPRCHCKKVERTCIWRAEWRIFADNNLQIFALSPFADLNIYPRSSLICLGDTHLAALASAVWLLTMQMLYQNSPGGPAKTVHYDLHIWEITVKSMQSRSVLSYLLAHPLKTQDQYRDYSHQVFGLKQGEGQEQTYPTTNKQAKTQKRCSRPAFLS